MLQDVWRLHSTQTLEQELGAAGGQLHCTQRMDKLCHHLTHTAHLSSIPGPLSPTSGQHSACQMPAWLRARETYPGQLSLTFNGIVQPNNSHILFA